MMGCAFLLVDKSSGFPKLHTVRWQNKNIIIVLGMRTELSGAEVVLPTFAEPRVREAARLYQACRAAEKECRILASGGDPAKHGVSEAAVIQQMLLRSGVPEKDILIEANSDSTYHNAKYTAEMLATESADLTVLVTSDVHLARALKMFHWFKVFPLPAPADIPNSPQKPG